MLEEIWKLRSTSVEKEEEEEKQLQAVLDLPAVEFIAEAVGVLDVR